MIKINLKKFSEMAILDCCLILSSAAPVLAIDYYVDAVNGNDENAGTSPELAWKTITRVNLQFYNFGDKILFKAGQTHEDGQTDEGLIVLKPEKVWDDSENADVVPRPVLTISSYGGAEGERATLRSDNGAISVYEMGRVHIHDLNIEGNDLHVGTGIVFLNEYGGVAEDIRIERVSVTNFKVGLQMVAAVNNGSKYRRIRINNSTFNYNGEGGLGMYGTAAVDPLINSGIEDVVIENSEASYNTGAGFDGGGYGFNLYGSQNAVIKKNRLIANGGAGTGANCAAIFGFFNVKMLIEGNLIGYTQYNGDPDPNIGANSDGNGVNVRGWFITIIRNIIFGSAGSAILIDGGGHGAADEGGTTEDMTVSHNLFLYNGTGMDPWGQPYHLGRDVQASIRIFYSSNKVNIFNNVNVISNRDGLGGFVPGVGAAYEINPWLPQGRISDIKLLNNAIVVYGNVPFVQIRYPERNEGIVIAGNNYYNPDGASKFEYCRPYCEEVFNTLEEFRAGTGHEMLDGLPVGLDLDPLFQGPEGDENGYRILPGSPLFRAGVSLARFEIQNPGTDFFGNPFPRTESPSIGVHQPETN